MQQRHRWCTFKVLWRTSIGTGLARRSAAARNAGTAQRSAPEGAIPTTTLSVHTTHNLAERPPRPRRLPRVRNAMSTNGTPTMEASIRRRQPHRPCYRTRSSPGLENGLEPQTNSSRRWQVCVVVRIAMGRVPPARGTGCFFEESGSTAINTGTATT